MYFLIKPINNIYFLDGKSRLNKASSFDILFGKSSLIGWKRDKTFLLVLFFNFSPTFFENEINLSQLLIKSLLKTPSNKIFS